MNLYETFNEQHLRSVVVYGKTADHKLYLDEAHTVLLQSQQAHELMQKQLLVVKEGETILRPVAFADGKVVTVTYSGASVAAVEWATEAAE